MPHREHIDALVAILDGVHIDEVEQKLKQEFKSAKVNHKPGDRFFTVRYQVTTNFTVTGALALRGTIFELDAEFVCRGKVLCLPFYKFFNAHEPLAKTLPFDWESARATRKEDGSLIKIFHYDNEWKVASNNTADAFKCSVHGDQSTTLGDLFLTAANNTGIKWDVLNPERIYCFELVGPLNPVVVRYDETKVFHLMTRCMKTLQELHPDEDDDIGVPRPDRFIPPHDVVRPETVPTSDAGSDETKLTDEIDLEMDKVSLTEAPITVSMNEKRGKDTVSDSADSNQEKLEVTGSNEEKSKPPAAPQVSEFLEVVRGVADAAPFDKLEGYVIQDRHGHRMKVKGANYVLAHRGATSGALNVSGNGAILKLILNATDDDIRTFNQERFSDRVAELKQRLLGYVIMCDRLVDHVGIDRTRDEPLTKDMRKAIFSKLENFVADNPEYIEPKNYVVRLFQYPSLTPEKYLLTITKDKHRVNKLPTLEEAMKVISEVAQHPCLLNSIFFNRLLLLPILTNCCWRYTQVANRDFKLAVAMNFIKTLQNQTHRYTKTMTQYT